MKPRRLLLTLAGSLLGLGLGAAGLVLWVLWSSSGPSLEPGDAARLEQQGNALLDAIEIQRERLGHFPDTLDLEDLPEGALSTRFGTWDYESSDGGAGFHLSVGDYGKNGFVLFWDASRAAWYWDT